MRSRVLGAVKRQDWQKLDLVAKELWGYQYWKSFHDLEHLKGWLLTNFYCAYCPADLLETHIQKARAHTDHILPHSKYSHLRNGSMMNAAAACDDCNLLKGDWDPNGEDLPLYNIGDEFSYEMRLTFIQRTIARLSGKSRNNVGRDENYMAKCRAAAEKAAVDLA